MKELLVILVHKLIYLIDLRKMIQQSDELIRAFAVRVTSAADLCNMVIKCLDTNCQKDVTYRDQVVHQIIIHGMRNNDPHVSPQLENSSDKVPYNYSVRHHLWGGVAPPPFFSYGGRGTGGIL